MKRSLRSSLWRVPVDQEVDEELALQMFGVSPRDPVTFASVGAVLGVTAVAACAMPALRAARVDPAVAFKSE